MLEAFLFCLTPFIGLMLFAIFVNYIINRTKKL